MLIMLLCNDTLFAQHQNSLSQEDKRTKNRRIADSLYYVHTVKKQQDSIKKVRLQEMEKEYNSNESKVTKKISKNNKLVTKISSKNTLEDTIGWKEESYKYEVEIPSTTLYQQTWFSDRVKTHKITLRDIPDEVTLRLCGKKGVDNFCFPYKGIKTSGYGWRWGRPHTGIDIALKTGDPIYAAFDGVVRVAKFNGGYGNMVLIRHYNNLETLYGHLSSIKVKVGQKVKAGDIIGLGGSTGRSTGPHLHFECRLLYACFDPEWIVDLKKYDLKTKLVRIDKSYFGIASSQSASDKKEKMTKLVKVNTLLDGTKFVSEKELEKMIATKEAKKNRPAKINNEDKTTWRYYKVKDEDTIEDISKRFNIRISDLVEINNLKDNNLKVGERIRVR